MLAWIAPLSMIVLSGLFIAIALYRDKKVHMAADGSGPVLDIPPASGVDVWLICGTVVSFYVGATWFIAMVYVRLIADCTGLGFHSIPI